MARVLYLYRLDDKILNAFELALILKSLLSKFVDTFCSEIIIIYTFHIKHLLDSLIIIDAQYYVKYYFTDSRIVFSVNRCRTGRFTDLIVLTLDASVRWDGVNANNSSGLRIVTAKEFSGL